LLLALMASGLSGQCFSFQGYLPTESGARRAALLQLERDSKQRRCTQMLIETPYRNQAMFADMLGCLSPSTRICVAADVTGPAEAIQTRSVAEWKRVGKEAGEPTTPTLARVPTMFLFMA
jgi:16S rRNA (cytidine1402-2'-O)-methyltransferase